ncbi:MAG: hypothetical protein HC923_03165 [Myxococcales bacterium]|nr:hypothetical protein [Myxococcales bacterium]
MRKSYLLLSTLALVACEPGSTDGIEEPVTIEYCESSYAELKDGAVVFTPYRCAENAMCAESISVGVGMCQDAADGSGRRMKTLPGLLAVIEDWVRLLERQIAHNPNWPFCTADSDCANNLCIFEPGCGTPRGLCCGGLRFSYCHPENAQINGTCQFVGCDTYCGCDGATFKGVPNRPFAYPGECRGPVSQ